jgi:hypothetical protein
MLNAAAYLAKDADDEIARRAVEGAGRPPLDAFETPVVPVSRTMEDWCDASAIELIDGPDAFTFDDGEDW